MNARRGSAARQAASRRARRPEPPLERVQGRPQRRMIVHARVAPNHTRSSGTDTPHRRAGTGSSVDSTDTRFSAVSAQPQSLLPVSLMQLPTSSRALRGDRHSAASRRNPPQDRLASPTNGVRPIDCACGIFEGPSSACPNSASDLVARAHRATGSMPPDGLVAPRPRDRRRPRRPRQGRRNGVAAAAAYGAYADLVEQATDRTAGAGRDRGDVGLRDGGDGGVRARRQAGSARPALGDARA